MLRTLIEQMPTAKIHLCEIKSGEKVDQSRLLDLPISDHDVIVGSNEHGVFATWNLLNPDSPVSPGFAPADITGLRGIYLEEERQEHITLVAKHTISLFKSGVDALALQEVPAMNGKYFDKFISALEKSAEEEKISLDFKAFKTSYMQTKRPFKDGIEQGYHPFGTGLLCKKDSFFLEKVDPILNGRGSYYVLQATKSKKKFTLINIHGDYGQADTLVEQISSYLSKPNTIIMGDTNIALAKKKAVEQFGTMEGIVVEPSTNVPGTSEDSRTLDCFLTSIPTNFIYKNGIHNYAKNESSKEKKHDKTSSNLGLPQVDTIKKKPIKHTNEKKEDIFSIVFDTGELFDLTEELILLIFKDRYREPWSKPISLEYFNYLFEKHRRIIGYDTTTIPVLKIQGIIKDIELHEWRWDNDRSKVQPYYNQSDINNLNYLLNYLPTKKNLLIRKEEKQCELNKQNYFQTMTNRFISFSHLDHLKDKIKISDALDIMGITIFYFTDVSFETLETIAESLKEKGLKAKAKKSTSGIFNDSVEIELKPSQLEKWLKIQLRISTLFISSEKPKICEVKPSVQNQSIAFQPSTLHKSSDISHLPFFKKPDEKSNKEIYFQSIMDQFISLGYFEHLQNNIKISDSLRELGKTLIEFTDVPFKTIQTIAMKLEERGLQAEPHKAIVGSDWIAIPLTLEATEIWLKNEMLASKSIAPTKHGY